MKPEYTHKHDEAFDIFDMPVQCGECYAWYDNSDKLPEKYQGKFTEL